MTYEEAKAVLEKSEVWWYWRDSLGVELRVDCPFFSPAEFEAFVIVVREEFKDPAKRYRL